MKAIEKPMKIDPNHPPVGRFAIDLRRATAGGFSTSLSIAFKSSGLNCTSVSKELKTYRASSQLTSGHRVRMRLSIVSTPMDLPAQRRMSYTP